MKLYWTDVRFWLGRSLWAAATTAAGGLGAWLAGGGIVTGLLFGLGYLAFSRLVVLAIRRTSTDADERRGKALWRNLRRLVGRYAHGTWLVDGQDNVLLLVRRKHGRWVLRVRWNGAEMFAETPTDQRRGSVPVDAFYASPYGLVHRIHDMWTFHENADGRVTFREIGDLRSQRREDLQKAIQLEQAAGLTTPSRGEVQTLVDQLNTARLGVPVILGCEGDG